MEQLRINKPADLEDELHYFSVDQTVDGLPVDMSDEVTSTKASFLGGATVLHMLPKRKKYSSLRKGENHLHVNRMLML